MIDPTNTAEVLAHLRRPFEAHEVKYRPSGGGLVAYVEAHTVMDRLDAVCPGWGVSYREVPGGVEATITINGISRSDVGVADGNPDMAVKGARADALKRAAHAWGVGRILRVLRFPSRYSGPVSAELTRTLREQYENFCGQPEVIARYGDIWSVEGGSPDA